MVILVWVGCAGGTAADVAAQTGHTATEDLAAALEAANHCEVAEDCVDLGSCLGFGCHVYVHVDEAAALSERVASTGGCTYTCILADPVCEAGRCVQRP
jgi:hypothetical protein